MSQALSHLGQRRRAAWNTASDPAGLREAPVPQKSLPAPKPPAPEPHPEAAPGPACRESSGPSGLCHCLYRPHDRSGCLHPQTRGPLAHKKPAPQRLANSSWHAELATMLWSYSGGSLSTKAESLRSAYVSSCKAISRLSICKPRVLPKGKGPRASGCTI